MDCSSRLRERLPAQAVNFLSFVDDKTPPREQIRKFAEVILKSLSQAEGNQRYLVRMFLYDQCKATDGATDKMDKPADTNKLDVPSTLEGIVRTIEKDIREKIAKDQSIPSVVFFPEHASMIPLNRFMAEREEVEREQDEIEGVEIEVEVERQMEVHLKDQQEDQQVENTRE